MGVLGVCGQVGMDGWRSEREKCREVENGDVIVNRVMFEFEGIGLREVKRMILNQKA